MTKDQVCSYYSILNVQADLILHKNVSCKSSSKMFWQGFSYERSWHLFYVELKNYNFGIIKGIPLCWILLRMLFPKFKTVLNILAGNLG